MGSLDYILNPKSIAVVGATDKPNSVGEGILNNLMDGGMYKTEHCKGFKGNIYPVNPKHKNIFGLPCYASVKDISGKVDLAVIAVPAKFVHDVVKDCVAKKIPGAVIISAGFAEMGNGKLQREVVETANKGGMRIIGPNCLGLMRTKNNLNASFAPSMPPKGEIAFISQSGAIIDSVIDWALDENIGFSTVISYGNRADLDLHDFLLWLDKDKETKAIAIYLEGLDDGRKFMEVAKKVNLRKPIIILKGGRTSSGAKAIGSHTGSIAGSYEVYMAAFRQSGITVARTIQELLDYSKALSKLNPPASNKVVIVTNAGGCGVLCADLCSERGVNISELSQKTIKALDDSGKMHPAYSRGNPLDIIGDALPERYEAAIDNLCENNAFGGMIVIQTLQTTTDSLGNAKVISKLAKKYPQKPIISTFLGGRFTKEGFEHLEKNGNVVFRDLERTVKVMKALIERGKVK